MSIDKNLLIMPDNTKNLIEPKVEQEKTDSNKPLKQRIDSFEVNVCVPCKRLFRTMEALLKHRQDSLLHIKIYYEMQQKKAKEENWARIKDTVAKKQTSEGDVKNEVKEMHHTSHSKEKRERHHHRDDADHHEEHYERKR